VNAGRAVVVASASILRGLFAQALADAPRGLLGGDEETMAPLDGI
jgi:hypothetical protein